MNVGSSCESGRGLRVFDWTQRLALAACATLLVAGGASALENTGSRLASDTPALIQPLEWSAFDRPVWSPDPRHVALSGQDDRGVYLLDIEEATCLRITDAAGSGYAFHFSPDGKRLGFKLLIEQPDGRFPLQQPVVFESAGRSLTALCEPAARVGVPSFSNDGTIAYTVDRELRILPLKGPVVTHLLDHYVNLAPISPDGTQVAFNNTDDAICVLDLRTSARKTLTPAGVGCFGPVWSGDSRRLAVNTTGGRLMSLDAASGQWWELGEGSDPSWMPDSMTLIHSRQTRLDGAQLIESDLYSVRYDGRQRTRLTHRPGGLELSARVSPDGARIAYVDRSDGRVHRAELRKAPAIAAGQATAPVADPEPAADIHELGASAPLMPATVQRECLPGTSSTQAGTPIPSEALAAGSIVLAGQVRLSRPCPYVHQVYDTPNSFNGHWACGASSAIMAIQYFEILPAWNVTVSTPYSHVSPFGQYVSAIYTYNGHTYNTGSADAGGKTAYGGYGYIVRNNWADTKGYMRDYFINHGLGSSVDWSPTWNELKTEINADRPFVVLNSLTTSGHYITTVGYFDGQYTAIFNDPYGNKNTPGYPSYDGTGVYYDWPGYNNGYQNLKTVHCFIYARGGRPPTLTQQPEDRLAARGATATFQVAAAGLAPISYRWQKNGANLDEGGRFSGVTGATLMISSLQAADAAKYRCVVSNTYGSVPSNEAQLRLNSPDFDGDGDVDSEDFAHIQACVDHPGILALPYCSNADLDGDGDVDGVDLTRFQACFAGPGVTPPPGCPE